MQKCYKCQGVGSLRFLFFLVGLLVPFATTVHAKDPVSSVLKLFEAIQDAQGDSRRRGQGAERPIGESKVQRTLKSDYTLSGLRLGQKIDLDKPEFRNFDCEPSIISPILGLCIRERQDREPRGSFAVTESLLVGEVPGIIYASKLVAPAFWSANEVEEDIGRITNKHKQDPKILIMPHRQGLPDAVIAAWGGVELEPLTPEDRDALAKGQFSRELVVDFVNDIDLSVKHALPI